MNATTDGVVLAPSAFSMTFAALPSMTETQEFVVPRSIPITWPVTPEDLHRDDASDTLYFCAKSCADSGLD